MRNLFQSRLCTEDSAFHYVQGVLIRLGRKQANVSIRIV